jgi:hypothetical protein
MAIRIAPTAAFANPVEAELLAAFGRPVIQSPKRQPFASPFRDGVRAKTTFYRPRAARPAGGITGWILDLGQLDRPGPGSLNKTHRYEFAVGINVFSGVNIICSYGEDPEFDVGG